MIPDEVNNSSNVNSENGLKLNQQLLYYYIFGIGGIIMVFVGIITNVFNLVVLSLKSMKSTTNKYLMALAVCDLFVLIFSQITLSNSFIHDYSDTTDSFILANLQSMVALSNLTDIDLTSSSLPSADSAPDLTTLMSVTDTGAAHTSSVYETLKSFVISVYSKWLNDIYPRVYPYVYPLAIMFQISTVWISLGMSVDRFIAIHFPFKSLKFCTISKAKKIIFAIFLISFVYCFPRFFEYKIQIEELSINNRTYVMVHNDLTYIGKSNVFRKLVYVWMYVLLQSVVPLILLVIINTALLLSLKESSKFVKKLSQLDNDQSGGGGGGSKKLASTAGQRTSDPATANDDENVNILPSTRKSTRSKSTKSISTLTGNHTRFLSKEIKHKDITIMIITVVVLFIILQTPAVVCNCIYGFNHYRLAFRQDTNYSAVCYVGNFFILTCSSINFFLYCMFNKRFRQELVYCVRRLVYCCCVCCWLNRKNLHHPHKKFYRTTALSQNTFIITSPNFFAKSSKSIRLNNNNMSNHVKKKTDQLDSFKLNNGQKSNCSNRDLSSPTFVARQVNFDIQVDPAKNKHEPTSINETTSYDVSTPKLTNSMKRIMFFNNRNFGKTSELANCSGEEIEMNRETHCPNGGIYV